LLVQRGEEFGLPSDPGSDALLWWFGHACIQTVAGKEAETVAISISQTGEAVNPTIGRTAQF
jgi:hypothetical protein